MTARIDPDRQLNAWLHDVAAPHEPEHLLGEVLARTARTRRRPAWRIPERWISMSAITSRLAPSSPVPWRVVGVVAALLLALVVGLTLYAGSRTRPPAPPFGLAANGQLAYSAGGDILVADSPGGAPRILIGGDTTDAFPIFSPDGSRFAFLRGSETSMELWISDTGGSNALKLAGPFGIPDSLEWSPQGDAIALIGGTPNGTITMVRVDGTGTTEIDTGLTEVMSPVFRPADGGQVSFRGLDDAGDWGFYLVNRDGTNVRHLELDPGFAADSFYDLNHPYYFQGLAWESTGSRFAYFTLEPDPASPAGPGYRLHVADIDAAGTVKSDRVVVYDPSTDDEWDPILIPGGEQVVFESIEGSRHELLLGDLVAGHGPARPLGVTANDDIWAVLSPDGRQLIAVVPGGDEPALVLIDLATLTSTPLAVSDDVTWQRLAP